MPTIDHWIHINGQQFVRDGTSLLSVRDQSAEDLYRELGLSYPKFFKMDLLCKWAFLGAETLLNPGGKPVFEGMDKTRVAVVLATGSGCLDIDKKYQHSTLSIPSPALFVYTLSNIMLGEICIRYGFKGEQVCVVDEDRDKDQLHFYVEDLLLNRGMDGCLCGWVDAISNQHSVSMFWVRKNGYGLIFSPAGLQQFQQSDI